MLLTKENTPTGAPPLVCPSLAVPFPCCAPPLLCPSLAVPLPCCAPPLLCPSLAVPFPCCAPPLLCLPLLCPSLAVPLPCCAPPLLCPSLVVPCLAVPFPCCALPLLCPSLAVPSLAVPFPCWQSSPPVAGQVTTRFPHLTSQSSVSLTTQTSTPPPILVTAAAAAASRKASLAGGQPAPSSAPTTRSSNISASTLLTAPNQLDGVVARVANLNIKLRGSSKSRTKATQASKSSSKSSRSRANNAAKSSQSSSSVKINQGGSTTSNESLRWEMALEDVDLERERIAIYKMNRRKRYLAAAQAKGLGWALNYNSQTIVTPLSEDSGVEMACGSPGMSAASAGAYIDFSSMQTLRPIPAHRGLQEAFVEC
ncbi:hypothetical protein ACOMHN_018858 [Nucella lapillus]